MVLKRDALVVPLMASRAVFGLVWVGSIVVTACSYGHPPPEVIAGRQFSMSAAAQLPQGTTMAEVKRILGEPLSVQSNEVEEYWEYRFTTTQREEIKLLGVIPWPAKERRGAARARLTFRDGTLRHVELEPPGA